MSRIFKDISVKSDMEIQTKRWIDERVAIEDFRMVRRILRSARQRIRDAQRKLWRERGYRNAKT